MISPEDRAAVDAAITAVLDQLRRRGDRAGAAAAGLTEAAARAADGGKRLRPALVVSGFRAFGGDPGREPAVWTVAAAFELLHSAFVVHDDLIDRDLERRGEPNVGGLFRRRAMRAGVDAAAAERVGDAASVLAGDLLLFEATRLIGAVDLDAARRAALFSLLDEAVLISAGGELADVQNAAGWPGAADPLDVARDKTAVYTFRAPLLAGAVLADAGDAQLASLEETADRLGLAFQLVDDLIGAFGTHAQAGREPGADLREGKRTPIIGFAHEAASWSRVSAALAVAHTGPIAVRRAQRELADSGARARAEMLVRQCLHDARLCATGGGLPAAATALLADLADRVEERMP